MRSLMKSFLLLNVFCSDNDKAFDIFYSTIFFGNHVFGIQCQIMFFVQQRKRNNKFSQREHGCSGNGYKWNIYMLRQG
jgi:hypothetical protein